MERFKLTEEKERAGRAGMHVIVTSAAWKAGSKEGRKPRTSSVPPTPGRRAEGPGKVHGQVQAWTLHRWLVRLFCRMDELQKGSTSAPVGILPTGTDIPVKTGSL